jgi:phage gp29-like protein
MATLLDPYGRPIQKQTMKAEQAGPTLRGIRQPAGNHQAPGLTPAKLARILRASVDGDPEAYLELAEDMEERNEHYAGVLGVRKRQVSGLEITVEAASDSTEDIADADLVRDVITRDGFEDELFDILDAIGKGFSATEIMWDTSEGQWTVDGLRWRDPRWFRFADEDGETLRLRGIGGDEDLWANKWIIHRAKVKSGLTIRGGLARSAAWAFLFKTFTLKDWAVFTEAYGQPLRVGKYGPDATKEERDKLLAAVANIGSDFAAIIPESMIIEFEQADVSGSIELYEKRADWLDRQISKLVLGQTGTTDAQAGGYAVGKVHDGVRDDIERADAKQLAASLNRDLVKPLVSVNHGPRKKYPKICIGRPDEIDIDKMVDNVVKLVPMGLKVGMSTLRDKIGLPEPDKDEELLVAPRQDPTDPSANNNQGGSRPKKPGDKPNTAAHSAQAAPQLDAIDQAVAEIVSEQWQAMVEPIVAGLDDQLAVAGSISEARDIIARRIETMGVIKMAELLARASFAARLAGETDEDL